MFNLRAQLLTKAKRRVIFILAVLFFLILAPLVIFYAIGYQIDLRGQKLLRTGGIFIKTSHAGFKLFINNKFIHETNFLSRGALVTNLVPDLYSIRVEKNGYRSWQKVVHVEPQTISEFRFVTLFPEHIKERDLLDLARRGLAFADLEPLEKSPWIMIKTKEKPALTYLFNKETRLFDAVASFDYSRWDAEQNRLVVFRKNEARWAMVTFAGGRLRETRLTFPKKLGAITRLRFHPEDADLVFVLNSSGALFRYHIKTAQAVDLISDAHSFAVRNEKILFVTDKGFFASADLDGKNIENYGRKGFFLAEKEVYFDMAPPGDTFMIDSAGGFFVRRRSEPEAVPIAGNVQGAVFSKTGDKLLFWSDQGIEVLWLEDELHQPFRKAGKRERVVSLPQGSLSFAYWIGSEEKHIIFAAGTFVAVADLDTRGDGSVKTLIFDNAEGILRYQPETNELLRGHKSFLFSAKIQ